MSRLIQLLVFAAATGLALLSAFVIVMNWICLVVSIRTKRFHSPVPFVGGLAGVAACAIGGWFSMFPSCASCSGFRLFLTRPGRSSHGMWSAFRSSASSAATYRAADC